MRIGVILAMIVFALNWVVHRFFEDTFLALTKRIFGWNEDSVMAFIVANIGSIAIAAACVGAIWLLARQHYKHKASQRIEIEYPNEANIESKSSTYKISTSALPQGQNTTHSTISSHLFYIGVYNPSPRTITNACISVLERSKPPHPMDAWLISKSTATTKVDIPRGRTELFLFLTGQDETDVGLFNPQIVSSEHYNVIKVTFERDRNLAGYLRGSDGQAEYGVPILKNDGITFEICAYADDCEPDKATVVVNSRHRLEVHVYRHAAITRRQLRIVQSGKVLDTMGRPQSALASLRSRLGIGRRTQR